MKNKTPGGTSPRRARIAVNRALVRIAAGRPLLPPKPVLSDGFDGQPEVLAQIFAHLMEKP